MDDVERCRSCGAERVPVGDSGRKVCPSLLGRMDTRPQHAAIVVAGPELTAWLARQARLQAVADMWATALEWDGGGL